jgi:hypothetical protein
LRLHRHLYHPSTGKLLSLLKRANPGLVSGETKDLLDEIVKACHACQTFSTSPLHFRIRTPEEVVFNQELRIDLMFLEDRKPVLHVVNAGTTFQAAIFLDGEDAASVWNAFLKCWSHALCGHPESLLCHQGSVFLSETFSENYALSEISLRHTGTESYNSLGVGERYHSPLRKVYQRVRAENPYVPISSCLAAAIFALNSTSGPEGLIPALLVFGMIPKLPSPSIVPLLNQNRRFKMLRAARDEYAAIVAKLRVQYGLNTRPPDAANHVYNSGDSVYVYRERERHWTGPHVVATVEGKDVSVHLGEATGPRHFNICQVKPSLLSAQVMFLNSISASKECPKNIRWTEVIAKGDPVQIQR